MSDITEQVNETSSVKNKLIGKEESIKIKEDWFRICNPGKSHYEEQQSQYRADYIAQMLAKIPERYKDASWEGYSKSKPHYTQQERANQLINWSALKFYANGIIDGKYNNAILCGTPGTGKTYLSFCVYKSLLEAGKRADRYKVHRLIAYLRESFSNKTAETKEQRLDKLLSLDFLIIDDIGSQKQYGTDAECTELYHVIDERYEAKKPTLITTNEGEEGIVKYMGEATYSRFLEDNGLCLVFDWADYRGL